MNEHDTILALIPGYPELRTPDRQRIDAHAQTCNECAAALQRQHRLRSQLAHAPRLVPDPAAVAAARAAIRERARPGGVSSGARRPRWLTVAAPAGVFALVAVLVGLLVVLPGRLPGQNSTPLPFPGSGQGSLPAPASAAVGEFVWQTDGAYGYEMLRPAGWEAAEAGDLRQFAMLGSGQSANGLGIAVSNLEARAGLARGADGTSSIILSLFEKAPTFEGWIAGIEQATASAGAQPKIVRSLKSARIYVTLEAPGSLSPMLMLSGYKVDAEQPLAITLFASGEFARLDRLESEGIVDDLVTMVESARAIPIDPQNVAPALNTQLTPTAVYSATKPVAAHGPQAAPTVAPALPNSTVAPEATSITGLPATCAAESPDTLLLVSGESGYCLRYPAAFQPRFSEAPDRPAGTWGVSLLDPRDPDRTVTLAIQTSLANGLTLEQVVAEELRHYPAEVTAQVTQTSSQFGGEPAIILDGLPGILTNRQAFVIHGDRLHRFALLPWHDKAFAERQAEAQALWDQVANSLAFVPALDNSYLGGLLDGNEPPVTLLQTEASGLAAQLTALELTEGELSAEICMDLPDNRDWHPMPRLSQGERRMNDNFSMMLVDGKLTQTFYATHRCYRFSFPLQSPGVSVAEPMTLSIERLALEPNEGEFGKAATCEAALRRLAERQPGITAECVDRANVTIPELVSQPEGMTREQAQGLIGEAYSENVYGPWTFTIPVTNINPTNP